MHDFTGMLVAPEGQNATSVLKRNGKMTMDKPGFGTVLRSHRLGWYYSPRHGCNIRMSTAGKLNVIELCPTNEVPRHKTETGNFRCWWDDTQILDMLPWLQPVRKIKKYVRVLVGDNGEIVQ